jgi:Cysteine-rich secretory protein family
MPATALEQMLLELINRARLDPAAEAARFSIDLNEGLAPNTLSGVSKQPLAMNETLLSVARAHSQDMIDRDYFAHDTPEGVTASQRIANAGYSAIGSGENIAARSTSGPVTNQLVLLQHQDLFVDTGVDGRGHRLNILSAAYQEVGVGQITGNFQGLPRC